MYTYIFFHEGGGKNSYGRKEVDNNNLYRLYELKSPALGATKGPWSIIDDLQYDCRSDKFKQRISLVEVRE